MATANMPPFLNWLSQRYENNNSLFLLSELWIKICSCACKISCTHNLPPIM